MNNLIDKGKILFIKKYPIPKNLKKLDEYDNKIRSINILLTLEKIELFLKKSTKTDKDIYSPYYIMHPILRYLATS